MYVYFLLLLFDLRLANNNYVTKFLQSNTYLQQPKLPACCDFCGSSAGSIRKKGPEAGKYSQKKMRSQLGILHNTGMLLNFDLGGHSHSTRVAASFEWTKLVGLPQADAGKTQMYWLPVSFTAPSANRIHQDSSGFIRIQQGRLDFIFISAEHFRLALEAQPIDISHGAGSWSRAANSTSSLRHLSGGLKYPRPSLPIHSSCKDRQDRLSVGTEDCCSLN